MTEVTKFKPTKLSPTLARISDSDRVPRSQKAAYSVGSGFEHFGILTVADRLWTPFFNIGLGLSPVFLGGALMVFRLLEALLAPVVGFLSDNTRTRWGRRRPWIVAGALLTVGAFPLMFLPTKSWSENEIIWHMLIVATLLFTGSVIWNVAFFALGLELTPDYDERTRVGAWLAFIGKVSAIPAGWILFFVTSALFVDPQTGKADIVAGVQAYSLWAVPLLLLLALLPAIFVKERYYQTEVVSQPRERFWASLKESASCIPLWHFTLATALLVFGFVGFRTLGVYVNIYYVYDGDIAAATKLEGVKSTVTFALGLASLPALAWLAERLDKRTVVIGLVAVAATAQVSNLWLIRPDMPYLQIIPAIFDAGIASSVWMFAPSMKADIADYDELQTWRRREGSLNSFYSIWFKLALALSAGFGSAIIQWTGFDIARKLQSADVLYNMVVAFSVLPAAAWVLCIASLLFYPLSRQRMKVIRNELEGRRGQI